ACAVAVLLQKERLYRKARWLPKLINYKAAPNSPTFKDWTIMFYRIPAFIKTKALNYFSFSLNDRRNRRYCIRTTLIRLFDPEDSFLPHNFLNSCSRSCRRECPHSFIARCFHKKKPAEYDQPAAKIQLFFVFFWSFFYIINLLISYNVFVLENICFSTFFDQSFLNIFIDVFQIVRHFNIFLHFSYSCHNFVFTQSDQANPLCASARR